MPEGQTPRRRLAFGAVAELYEQVRPSYPQSLVEVVLAHAQLEPGDRILDVGAGTGKATRLFAGRGHEIVALEPSPQMAGVARATLAEDARVTVVEGDFEGWELPPEPFKLLISAQAWHWIDPAVRYVKARAALERGGALAAFWNHVDWQRVPLRPVLAEAYRQAAPEFAPSGPMHPLTEHTYMVPEWEAEIESAGGFEQPLAQLFRWEQRYGAHEYARLLATHSDHAILDPVVRGRLLQQVEDAIESQGGELELTYVTHLCMARAG